jgi:hypothetical protein
MKRYFRYDHRTRVICVFLVCLFWGCASVEQRLDEVQSYISAKLNLDEAERSAEASNETDREEAEAASAEPIASSETPKPLPRHSADSPESRTEYYKHTVRWSGESLSLIAKWYTGSFKNWRTLADTNPQINPRLIKKGDVISIPAALLQTKEPLPQKVAAKYTPNYFAHTVKRDGEKMVDIAKWYTGDPANWRTLVTANPKTDPNHLLAGHKIYIPHDLLKTREPIPPPKAPPPIAPPVKDSKVFKPDPPPDSEEKIELFGPKQFRKG